MPVDQPTLTDQRYLTAQTLGVPPYMWIPPANLPLLPTNNRRNLFPASNKKQEAFGTFCQTIQTAIQKGKFEAEPHTHHVGKGKKLTKIPHPFSDFSHDHPKNLGPLGSPPPEPFQRMKMAFDWIMCRAYELLNAINETAKANNNREYREARDEYIAFIGNLDNHEPEQKKGQVNPAKCLGYGKVIKWAYIDPVVEPHPSLDGVNVITGATIVIEWNPHSSSSGIPVKHP